jgi:RNA polymerase sigma-70 factor (ECF subfamily)
MPLTLAMREHNPLLEPEVIEQARCGDAAAFRQIVLAYRDRVFHSVARLIGRPEDVEDVAQDIFVRLHQSLRQLRAPELFEAWLKRITANATYDYLRRRRRSHEVCLSDLGEEQAELAFQAAAAQNGSDDLNKTRVREQVESLLTMIPLKDRVLLVLKEVDGLSLKELEGVYGVDSCVLKRRLFRARQRTLKAFAASAPERVPTAPLRLSATSH